MTERQIHWIGEAAQSIVFMGFLYLVIHMDDGPTHHPLIAMPMAPPIL